MEGVESGEGEGPELDAGGELVAGSRRGEKSMRALNLAAYEVASFPPYPEAPPPDEAFALPAVFIDADAPLSARKWYARRLRSPTLPRPPLHRRPPPARRCNQSGQSEPRAAL